jgi:sugar/nucleoside kinase (ribokinase family)
MLKLCRRLLPISLIFQSPGPFKRNNLLKMSTEEDDSTITFHIAGDAYVDFFCFLDDGGWPENGGDSRLEQPVKSYAGGSATNTATHLKSLVRNFSIQKPQVNLHTVLNPNDHYGQVLLQHAVEHDFPITNCRNAEDGLSTGHCIAIVSGGERSFMTHQGCVGQFGAQDLKVETIISTPKDVHFHVAGFYNIPGFWHGKLMERIEYIRQQRKVLFPDKNTTASLVTQHDATKVWDGGLDDVIPLLDFAIMNDLEARNIVKRGRGGEKGDSDNEIENWATFFGSVSETTNIIVTRGEQGAVALRGGKIIADQPTIAVKPVDPTGAGDSFTAGFIHGIWSWKFQSKSQTNEAWPIEAIEEGLRWGCAVGRAAVLVRGASVPPEPEDIERFRQHLPRQQ